MNNENKLTKEHECMKALQCLYLEVDSTIADDVKQKVLDALNEVKNKPSRLLLAGMAMQGILSKWNITAPTEIIVARNSETDQKITGEESCEKTLVLAIKMSYMAVDELLRQESL